MKKLRRILLTTLLVVLVVGLIAPFLRADWLRPRIEAALEAALNRPVHIGAVGLNLFTGPGFTVKNVLIDDDPAAGIEPFAHVESMQARVSLLSLFEGKLAFSSLRLGNPSVNLVKIESGPWNIQPLLDRRSNPGPAHRRTVPDIQIRGGRLNFKFGDNKSVFYISDADVDIYPNDSGEVVIRFSGAPARTDRGSQAFGQLSARGLLRSGPDGEDRLSMGVRLERTAISEVMRLFNGRDLGVHGFAIANAKLAGPLSKLQVTGDLNIHDVHRWDLMPVAGEGWTLKYRGLLNLREHQLNLETGAVEGHPQLVSVKLRLVDYLAMPKWAVSFLFRDLPALSLLETARHMGAPLPPGVQVEGKINGGIGYSNERGLEGRLALDNSSLRFPEGEALDFESANILLSKNRIALAPATIRMDNGQSAEVEGEYALDNSYAALDISTRQLTIAEVESSAGQILKAAPIPLLEKLQRGTWKGRISFVRLAGEPGAWSGEYDLQNASMEIPGLSSPVRFASASVEMKAGQIKMSRIRGHAGLVDFDADYRYDSAAGRPHRLRIRIPKLQLAELEDLMLPALRRKEGFLARTFRLRDETLPKWLQEREVDGSIEIGTLLNDDAPLGKVQAHLVWDGGSIEFPKIECVLDEMRATGTLTVNLAKAVPSYRLAGSIENLDYRNGRLDLDGELIASGLGEEMLLNLRSAGTFQGRGISLGPDSEVGEITGAFRVAPGIGLPRVLLSNLEVAQGDETLSGQGSVQSDGHIVLDLVSGRKQIHLTGMLLPIHPEPVPPAR
jgi:hypothetical protein